MLIVIINGKDHLALKSLQHFNRPGSKDKIESGIAQRMQGVKREAGSVGGKKRRPCKGLDKTGPKPQVHEPPEDIPADYTKNAHARPPGIGSNFSQ